MLLTLTYDSYYTKADKEKVIVNMNNVLYMIPDGNRTRISMLDNTMIYVKESLEDIMSII